jgi:hypothetical protein
LNDVLNNCPEHTSGVRLLEAFGGIFHGGYGQLVWEAFEKLHRDTMRSVSAIEVLFSTAVHYCDSCYWIANDGFEENRQVFLCETCLAARQTYVDRIYHGGHYCEPPEVVFVQEGLLPYPVNTVNPDEFENTVEGVKGVPCAAVDPVTIVFGVVGSAGAIASMASAVIAARQTGRLPQQRDGNNANNLGDVELRPQNNVGNATAGTVIEENPRVSNGQEIRPSGLIEPPSPTMAPQSNEVYEESRRSSSYMTAEEEIVEE